MLLVEMLLIIQENPEFREKVWSGNLNWPVISVETI